MSSIKDYIANLKGDKRNLVENLNLKGVEASDNETFTELIPKVLLAKEIPVEDKHGINFYDFDGTLLYSYTPQEFKALNEMPALPQRGGLIYEGWNWELEDLIDDIDRYNRYICVGPYCKTDDNTLRFYINLEYLNEVKLNFDAGQSNFTLLTINWGDGSPAETYTKQDIGTSGRFIPTHTYSQTGKYIIVVAVEAASGDGLGIGDNYGSYPIFDVTTTSTQTVIKELLRNALYKVELSADCFRYMGNYAFGNLGIRHITIPKNIASSYGYMFSGDTNLEFCVVPNSVSSGFGGTYYFNNCKALKAVATSRGTNNTISNQTYMGATNLIDLHIPKNIKNVGQYSLPTGSSLNLVFPDITTFNASSHTGVVNILDFRFCTAIPTTSSSLYLGTMWENSKVLVPENLYSDWIAATGWSSFASYIYPVDSNGNILPKP